MFVAVGLGVAHVAHKTGEGGISWPVCLALGFGGALFGGIGAATAGMSFYGVIGQMVVALGCGTLGILLWRQLRIE